MSPEKLATFYLRYLGLSFCIYTVLLLMSIPEWLLDLATSRTAQHMAYVRAGIDARLMHDAAYVLLGVSLIVFARPVARMLVKAANGLLDRQDSHVY